MDLDFSRGEEGHCFLAFFRKLLQPFFQTDIFRGSRECLSAGGGGGVAAGLSEI